MLFLIFQKIVKAFKTYFNKIILKMQLSTYQNIINQFKTKKKKNRKLDQFILV